MVLRVERGPANGTFKVPTGTLNAATPGVNLLTSVTDDVEPLTGMPRLSGFPVEVTAV